MDNKVEYIKSGSNNIAMLFNEAKYSDRLVIILHSFTAGKDGNTERQMAEELSSRGVSSVRFDFTGVGDSKANFSEHIISKCIDDTFAVYEVGKEKGYTDIALFGFSMGGNVALNLAINEQGKFSRLALNAPAANVPMTFEGFGIKFMDEWKRVGFFPYKNQINNELYNVSYNFYEDAKKCIVTPEKAKRIIIPTFFIHGTADVVVPYQSTVELYNHMKDNAVMILEENATHGLDVVPKGYELTKEDMIKGIYRQNSIKQFGDFLARKI